MRQDRAETMSRIIPMISYEDVDAASSCLARAFGFQDAALHGARRKGDRR